MAELLLFGLSWPLSASGQSYSVASPSVLPGDSVSVLSPLIIAPPGPLPGSNYALSGSVEFKLQRLRVWLRFIGLSITKDGQNFRPAPGADGSRVILAMGTAPANQRRLRIGPSILDNFVVEFDMSGKAVGLIRSPSDFLTASPSGQVTPLSILIAQGKRIVIDLNERVLLAPPGAIESTLSAQGPGIADRKAAGFANDKPVAVAFSDIAANKPLAFDLAMASGSVPLNIPEAFVQVGGAWPSAPIEARTCRLGLELTSTGKPGSLLTAARLLPPKGGAASLIIQGLRNSRNRAERWRTTDALSLAFRDRAGAVWSTPLLAPLGDADSPKLVRTDDVVEGKVIPLHGWFGASQFRPDQPSVSAALMCAKNTAIDPGPPIASIDKTLQYRATRPWLRLADSSFRHSRPGTTYHGKANTFIFETSAGYCGGAPMLPRACWEAGQNIRDDAALRRANDDVNDAFKAMVLASKGSVHETGLGDRTNDPGQPPATPPAIVAVLPDPRVASGSIQLEKNDRQIDMASPRLVRRSFDSVGRVLPLAPPAKLTLPIAVPEATAPEYAVLWPDQDGSARPWVKLNDLEKWGKEIVGAIDPAAPFAIADLLNDVKQRPKDFPMAILKISRRLSLEQILKEIQDVLPASAKVAFEAKRKKLVLGKEGLIADTDAAVIESDWVGLAIFDAPIDFGAFPLLKAIVPTDRDAPRLSFLTVSPREAGKANSDIAMSGAIDWTNRDTTTVVQADQTQEAKFKPISLSVAFRDRRMIRFHARAELTFYSFFGVKSEDGKERAPIFIIGSARRVSGVGKEEGAFEIRFAAEVASGEKLVLYPMNGPVSNAENTFLKTAWLKRVEVVDAPNDAGGRKAEIEMDGGIEFRKPDVIIDPELANFFNSLRAVDFSGLKIDLPDVSGGAARPLNLRYPSIKFNLDLPHISLLGDALKLKFRQLALDWETGLQAFDLGQFPRLPLPGTADLDLNLPKILFLGRLDFGSLPDLFARSLSGFSLEGLFGLNIKQGKFLPEFRPYIGIGGFGFDGLNFDLMSFIKLRIDHLRLGRAPWTNGARGAALHIEGASLDVVGIPVLKEGSGAFFSQDKDAGNGFWAAFRGYDFPLFQLDWGFVGQNVDFPPSIPKALLAPPPENASSEDFTHLADTINTSWGRGEIIPASGTASKGWTFAASIQAFKGAFRGQVLFQDGGFAGLSLGGPALKQLLNWDFAFTGIYRKDITPGEDFFYFSVTLPAMTFGSVRYTGGTIAAEIYTSGDFMADLGFPWRASRGGRQWERTIGAIVTPGQASGGFYVKKRRTHLPDTGKSELTISGGVAIQWGLGAAFGGGIFTVWVRIGIYAIVEGSIILRYSRTSAEIVAFTLQGAAGILVEGEGKIDWWIIAVRVGVRASAEIRAALIWDGRPTSPDKRVFMPIEAELSVTAFAEACIGGGCARICRSIEVGINIPVRYQLQFG